MKEDYVTLYFPMWKDGGIVKVEYRGSNVFTKQADLFQPYDPEKVFAVDTESTRKCNRLVTDLVPAAFEHYEEVFELDEDGSPLEKLLEKLSDKFGTASPRPAQIKKRKRRGRRFTPPSVLSVWFNLPYDVTRLFPKRHELRSLYSGGESFDTAVGSHVVTWERYIDASAPHFTWFVRDKVFDRVYMVKGFDLTGYWKCSLERALKAVGLSGKDDIEAVVKDVHNRPFESFSPAEVKARKAYAATDARQTLALWHETVKLLVSIDPRVIRKGGLPPPSAPGAAARMMFARAFDLHPERSTWPRPPDWADRLGALAYYGGRAFCARPGRYEGLVTLDLKSAYPHAMARLPDPVTCEYVEVKKKQRFRLEDWAGKFGVLEITGEALDRIYPAFRVHEKDALKYIAGRFEKIPVTIPEICIGVARGALRIDAITDGVWLKGSPDTSFIRSFIVDMYKMKEEHRKSPLGELAKLLMNSSYGKLIQVTDQEMSWDEFVLVPNLRPHHQKIARSLLHIAANHGDPCLDKLFFPGPFKERAGLEEELGETLGAGKRDPVTTINAYMNLLVRLLGKSHLEDVPLRQYLRDAKDYSAGPYFMPVFASQITGLVSAQLGAMASCLGALAGDTDSVHVRAREDGGNPLESPGGERYFDVMARAGYPSPRHGGFTVEGLTLGMWEAETPCPSSESYLVRPKRYSHLFKLEKGPVFKQATHGMSRFTCDLAEETAIRQDLPKEERLKKAAFYRQAAVHDAMRELLAGEPVTYQTRKAPRKGRTAKRTGELAGEFVDRLVTVTNPPVRHARIGRDGWVRWDLVGSRLYHVAASVNSVVER